MSNRQLELVQMEVGDRRNIAGHDVVRSPAGWTINGRVWLTLAEALRAVGGEQCPLS